MKLRAYTTSPNVARVNIDMTKFEMRELLAQYKLRYPDPEVVDALLESLEEFYEQMFKERLVSQHEIAN